MTNNINANTDIKEILKQVEQVVTPESQSMTAILGGYYMGPLKGKSSGCAQQANQASAVETSRSVAEQAKEIVSGCNAIVSGGSNVPDGEVKHPLVGQSVKEKSDDGRSL